jgi:hypothetical protein
MEATLLAVVVFALNRGAHLKRFPFSYHIPVWPELPKVRRSADKPTKTTLRLLPTARIIS